MKNHDLDVLSKAAGTSRATVSKVLNHCDGVGDGLREKVIKAAHAFQLSENPADTDLYVILPDNPKYFWGEARAGVRQSGVSVRYKMNLYSELPGNSTVVEDYLNQAKQLNAKMIVIAAAEPSLFPLLRAAAKETPILFLSEYVDIENTFYVGSDAFRDGFTLGKAYLDEFIKYSHIICLTKDDNINCSKRAEGFKKAIEGRGELTFQKLQLPPFTKSLPAQLARMLKKTISDEKSTCVFCTDGITSQISLAVSKAGFRCACIGFENPDDYRACERGGKVAAYIRQNVSLQAATAMQLAEKYVNTGFFPDQKSTYINSDLVLCR